MLNKNLKNKKKRGIPQTLVAGMALSAAFLLQGNVAKAAQDVSINETNFPDAVFRSYISDNFDENKDGNLDENEIAKVETIAIVGEYLEWDGREPYDYSKYTSAGVTSVKGIEYFTNLKILSVAYNDISELDISKNTALEGLNCSNNHLKTLDVRNNPELEQLDCRYNELKYVDISRSPKLSLVREKGTTGYPGGTGPLPGKTYTKIFYVASQDPHIEYVLAWDYSTSMINSPDYAIDEVFPDEGFRKYIKEHFDTDGDGMLSTIERCSATTIDCSGSADSKGTIKSLEGLKFLPFIETLKCSNNQIESLDLTGNEDLRVLDCSSNPLKELKLYETHEYKGAERLREIYCNGCELTKLDITNCNMEDTVKYGTKTVDQDVTTYTYKYTTESNNSVTSILKVDKNVEIIPEIAHASHATAFNIVPETMVIAVNEEKKVEYTLEPEDADQTIYWNTEYENNGYAYVSDGILYGREIGKVKITASTENCLVDSFEVVIVLDSDESNPFADVTSKTGWEYPFVKKIFDMKVMNGKGKLVPGRVFFAPNDTLTRAEFAQVLYNMEKTPEVTYKNVFTDVPEGKWYTNAIMWAYENGVVAGKGDYFDVDAPATREQVAVMLRNYAQFKGYDVTVVDGNGKNIDEFTDKDSISNWATDGLKWALANGIMVGKENNILDPTAESKRSECAAMLTHFLENVQK